MTPDLAARLEAMNASFYREHAQEFARTRGAPWPGWQQLLELPAPASVLDVGCGHGRFFEFLAKHQRLPSRSLGIDGSQELLDRAKNIDTPTLPEMRQFDLHDLDELAPETFDWVTFFGVMHHIPGKKLRQQVLQSLRRRVAPGGVLVVTYWRFAGQARFADRIEALKAAGVEEAELQVGDHLLPWSDNSMRYVHQISDAELAEQRQLLGPVPREWRADGATRDMNHYLCWRF